MPAAERFLLQRDWREQLRKTLFAALRLAFGAAILLYLWRSGAIRFRDLDKLVAQWPLSLAAIAVLFFDVYLMALRTSILLRAQDLHLPISTAVRLTLVSSWFAIFSPGAAGGDIAKIFYATRDSAGRRAEATTVLLLDRAIGLFSLLLLPLFFTPFFLAELRASEPLRQLFLFTAALSAVALLAFVACFFNDPFRNILANNAPTPDSKRGRLLRALDTLRFFRRHSGTLALSLLIALFDNCLVIVTAALALMILNPTLLSSKLALVVPLGTVANSIPLTPGGLGVGEAAFDKVFALAGLSLGAQTLVCTRLWKLVAAIPGLLLYLRGVGSISLQPNRTHPPVQQP
jgi:uncharacterized membrane protein YbhN (UPF0104 family)